MTGKTISTTLTHAVTLNSSYPSPLTIAGSGAIEPGVYAGTALYVGQKATLVTIVNHGSIVAGLVKFDENAGYAGYQAVDLNSGTSFTNTGAIVGGTGGSAEGPGGVGGIGIDIRAASTVVNSGNILGGAGGYGSLSYGSPGAGGVGVYLATAATLTNSGVIQGGAGGGAYEINSYGKGWGGTGVSTSGEGVINNTGLIFGGNGNSGAYNSAFGDSGGYGVILGDGGTLTNGGTIFGGDGGGNASARQGGSGMTGVYFEGSSGSNTGAIFGGAGAYGGQSGGVGGVGVVVADYGSFGNSGRVVGGGGGIAQNDLASSGAGGAGLVIFNDATVNNSGRIYGGYGGYGPTYVFGGAGGDGAYVLSGALTNRGTIAGGYGGDAIGSGGNPTLGSDVFGGRGGTGVIATSQSSVANYGVVLGGGGGNIGNPSGVAGEGGYGVIDAGTFVNHGTVIGGAGGSSGASTHGSTQGGKGSVGLLVVNGATATNAGTIIGGIGGTNQYFGVAGGYGVSIYGGTFIDSGVVRGGAGGHGNTLGLTGAAVYLGGTTAGTLVLNPGASFSGLVLIDGQANNVLELAGTSTGTLAGFGTEFINVGEISFATGAQRIIEGGVGSMTDIAGFAAHDTIVLDGYTTTLAAGDVSNATISLRNSLGSNTIFLSGSTAKDVIIADGGGKTTISAAGTAAHTIGTNAEQFVLSGGTATASKITAGGIEQVEKGGTSTAGTIAGGTLVLDVGAHVLQGIGFTTATGGKLIIDSATMPTATITGFIAGDTIKLAGVVYNPNDTVKVATAGTVTIAAPGTSYQLNIAGATVGETDFRFGTGSVLTRTAAPKMAFLSREAAVPAPGHTPMGTFGFAELFAHGFREAAPQGGRGFALLPHPDPLLIHGVGHGGFTISDFVGLEMGLVHHAGVF